MKSSKTNNRYAQKDTTLLKAAATVTMGYTAKQNCWFDQLWLPQLQFKTTILYTVEVHGKFLEAMHTKCQ